MKAVCLCFGLVLTTVPHSIPALADQAPATVACNEARSGILDETDRWVLAKPDAEDEGRDHYELVALSAWASKGNSEYCIRWELENRSPDAKNASGTTMPTIIKNVWWADTKLFKDRLQPGGHSSRAVMWTEREFSATPIDQDTDVTGGLNSTFKLKAYLPRSKQANAGQSSDSASVERIAIGGSTHFSDIKTGYMEGEASVSIRSSAIIEKEEIRFGIAVEIPSGRRFESTSFPFAHTVQTAKSLDSFSGPLDYKPLDLPIAYHFDTPLNRLKEGTIYVVSQPLIVQSATGKTCILTSVYSPIAFSLGRSSCK
jgi:hypothetical protein